MILQVLLDLCLDALGIEALLLADDDHNLVLWIHDPDDHFQGLVTLLRVINAAGMLIHAICLLGSINVVFDDEHGAHGLHGQVGNTGTHHSVILLGTLPPVETNNHNFNLPFLCKFI